MRKLWLLSYLGLCVIIQGQKIPESQYSTTLETLEQSPNSLNLKGPETKDASDAIRQLNATAKVYKAEFPDSRSLPVEYVNTLNKNAVTLNKILKERDVDAASVEDIQAINEDLRLKIKGYELSKLSVIPFRKILVSAHTKLGTNEQSCCEVWWAYFSDRGDPGAYTKFRKDSSPAKDYLYPGVYMMYTQVGGHKGQLIRVPVDPSSPDVDLPIPQ